MAMFDRDRNGSMNSVEFAGLWQYLRQWKAAFSGYDRDRSGTISHPEVWLYPSPLPATTIGPSTIPFQCRFLW